MKKSVNPRGGIRMEHKGISIKNAIEYLDSFYSDLGLMFGNFESLLSEKKFISHPNAGNKTTYHYSVSNHMSRNQAWTLKNIQRFYLDEKKDSVNKAIICSASLYPSSVFNIPVLICGIIKYKKNYSLYDSWNFWPSRDIVELDSLKSSWRLINKKVAKRDDSIFNFQHISKKDTIESFSVFFIDMIKLESSTILAEKIVEPLVDLYKGKSGVALDDNFLIKPIPAKLFEIWIQEKELDKDEEDSDKDKEE